MEGVDVETFFGPFFIILCIVFMLYGLFCAQVFYYGITYQDRSPLKIFVFSLFVFETLHVVTCIHILYSYLILDFAIPSKLSYIIWTVGFMFYLEHTIGILVQSYYIHRVWRVSQNLPLSIALAAIETARLALGFKTSAYTCIYHTWDAIGSDKTFNIYANITLSLNIFVDSSIAIALIYYFSSKSRSSAHARSTKKILLKLMYYAITAGALTVVTSAIALITYNVSVTTLTYSGFVQIVAKLNANSVLAMLNARRSIMRRSVSSRGMSLELSGVQNRNVPRPETAIHVLQETIVTGDKWKVGVEQDKYDEATATASVTGADAA